MEGCQWLKFSEQRVIGDGLRDEVVIDQVGKNIRFHPKDLQTI